MPIVIPTLTAKGFADDIETVADRLLSYMLVCRESDTSLYRGHIVSLQALIARYGNDPARLSSQVKDALDAYYGAHFTTADATVSCVPFEEDDSKYNLIIEVIVSYNGVKMNVNRSIPYSNGKILVLQEIINGQPR